MTKYCEIEFKNDRRKEIVNQKNNAIERSLTAVGMQGGGYAKIKCLAKKDGEVKKGSYNGNFRNEKDRMNHSVYIGTNVELDTFFCVKI